MAIQTVYVRWITLAATACASWVRCRRRSTTWWLGVHLAVTGVWPIVVSRPSIRRSVDERGLAFGIHGASQSG